MGLHKHRMAIQTPNSDANDAIGWPCPSNTPAVDPGTQLSLCPTWEPWRMLKKSVGHAVSHRLQPTQSCEVLQLYGFGCIQLQQCLGRSGIAWNRLLIMYIYIYIYVYTEICNIYIYICSVTVLCWFEAYIWRPDRVWGLARGSMKC